MPTASQTRSLRHRIAGLTALGLLLTAQVAPAQERNEDGRGRAFAQQPPSRDAQPAYRSSPSNGPNADPSRRPGGAPGVRPGHLAQWLDSHRGLPLAEQQQALSQEPGFNQLRPEVQQRMRERLNQLNSMSPERRSRLIARTEAMERLAPPQRQQVRNALGQLGSLPPDRQRAVSQAFHAAMNMPEPQRQAWLNSPQVRGQFSDNERQTLNSLVTVAPAASGAGLSGFAPRPPQSPYTQQQPQQP